MLFEKALRRDLLELAGIVFATLFGIMLTTSLIRFLGRAASDRVDTASVLPLIVFNSIHFLPVLLVLTVYVAVLMSLTRAFRDSEMVIWFSSGMSLRAWIRPVLAIAVPVAVLVATLSLFITPWADRQASEYQQRFAQREDVSQVAAGRFRESVSTNRVFFVESLDDEQSEVRNVFVNQTQGDALMLVVSRRGHIENRPDGSRFLVLEDGRRYDGTRSQADLRLMEFARYGLRLKPHEAAVAEDRAKFRTTAELVRDPVPRNLGELTWRVSLPVSTVLMALLAIPLSSVNPRVGRSVNLFAALLIYLVYNNLQSVFQSWISRGQMRFGIGVWVLHAVLLALIVWLFHRHTNLPQRGWRHRRRAAALARASP